MKNKIAKVTKDASQEKKAELAKQEEIITRGMSTFIEVGLALETIDREKLYRADGFKKFADYYREKWGYDRSYISRLMSGAVLGQAIREEMPKLNLLESHVRELAPLVKEKKGKPADFGRAINLVEKLTDGGKKVLTADDIKAEVSKGQRRRAVDAMDPAASSAKLGGIKVIDSPEAARALLELVRVTLLDWTKTWPRLDRPKPFKGYDQPVHTAIAKLKFIDEWLEEQVGPKTNEPRSKTPVKK